MPTQLSNVETILGELVAFKSTSTNFEQTQAVLNYVQAELESYPLHVSRYESSGFGSLIATSQQGFSPTLWLVGHVDVVDASDEMFEMKVEKDRLLGRGVIDDKFAAASFIVAIDGLGEEVAKHNFGIMLVSDEEVGSENGAKHLINSLNIGGEVAFIPDSGLGWTTQTRAKGGLHFKLTMKGKAAHGSMPWEGQNAIEELFKAITDLKRDLKIPDVMEAKGKFLMTFNVGKMSGGKAANQVPEHAEAMIDIRFIETEDADDIRRGVERLTKKYPGLIAAEVVYAAPVNVPADEPWIKKYDEILESFGIKTSLDSSTGATDARFFAELGIPTIVSQPSGGNLHADGEWIDREGLNLLPKIIEKLILET